MQSQNRLFDDLARVFGGAAGVASDVRTEAEARVRDQLEKLLSGMDLVTREEYEVVQAMATKARSEQEELAERVATLEARLAELEKSGTTGARRKGSSGSATSAKRTSGTSSKTAASGKSKSGSKKEAE